jgi:hypothetical protein
MASPRSSHRSRLDVLTAVVLWPVSSQQRARRNALVASTALTRRRIERDDVESFLRALDHRRSLPPRPAALPAEAPASVALGGL